MANGGDSNGYKFNPVSWGLGIVGALLTALLVALWNGNARLAVVEANTSNIKEVYADHEKRMRRLERIVSRGAGREERGDL